MNAALDPGGACTPSAHRSAPCDREIRNRARAHLRAQRRPPARPRRSDSGWRPISIPRLNIRGIRHLARHHVDDDGLDTDAWMVAITAHRIEEGLRTLGAP